MFFFEHRQKSKLQWFCNNFVRLILLPQMSDSLHTHSQWSYYVWMLNYLYWRKKIKLRSIEIERKSIEKEFFFFPISSHFIYICTFFVCLIITTPEGWNDESIEEESIDWTAQFEKRKPVEIFDRCWRKYRHSSLYSIWKNIKSRQQQQALILRDLWPSWIDDGTSSSASTQARTIDRKLTLDRLF